MVVRDYKYELNDILMAIDFITAFTEGMDFAAFQKDPRTIAAVERNLIVLVESARRLGDQAEILCPDIAWDNIRGIRQWLQPEFHTSLVKSLWHIMQNDLQPLWRSALRAVTAPSS